MAILAQQPVKAIYLLGALGFEIARLPLVVVKNILSFGRAHPEWSFRQSLGVHGASAFIRHVASIQNSTPLPLEPGAEGERFVVVQPASNDAYQGPLRSNADVKPVEIGATWYPASLTAGSNKSNVCVVLHIHGGAYVIGDGRTQGTGEYGPDLGIPSPAAALLWSPWINPADTSGSYVYDNDHYATDYLCTPFTAWGTAAYAGLAGMETLKQPYISHKNRTFKTETPLFVNTGGAEVLYYDDVEWAEHMKKAGNNVKLDVEKTAPHDILLIGNMIGFDTEATNSAKRAGEWLKEVRE